MPLPPADYKTFAELAEYARQRAKISAERNGHQEFAYWYQVYEWAEQGARLQQAKEQGWKVNPDPDTEYERLHNLFAQPRQPRGALPGYIHLMSDFYWQAVHLRRMLVNRGEKPPRLSLDWLREAAKRL